VPQVQGELRVGLPVGAIPACAWHCEEIIEAGCL
jgi:hypothetical protein